MATNGQSGENEALQSIERAITGIGKAPAPNVEPADENSITGFAESLADQYRALARHALEHGNYLSQMLNEHADKLLSDHRRVTSLVLQAERKLVADAENFIGK